MNKLLIAVVVCGMTSPLWAACDKGYTEYKDVCVSDIKPETAAPVEPSEEEVPKDKMPSYQRDDVKTIEIPSFKTESEEADAQIKFANQGKEPK